MEIPEGHTVHIVHVKYDHENKGIDFSKSRYMAWLTRYIPDCGDHEGVVYNSAAEDRVMEIKGKKFFLAKSADLALKRLLAAMKNYKYKPFQD